MKDDRHNTSKSVFPILIAEDNKVACKYLKKILVEAGYTVVSADNGRKALEIFNERFYPIVLTDWMMPEMTGLELCKAIRERKNKGYVFIVILTARDKKTDIITGLEAGADDYLTKPVNYAELVARLNSGIRILDLERNLREANEKIKILTITDPLTGCFNREYMKKTLIQEVKRARRYKHPLSVIFCDIDYFKQVNDTYGHQAGDLVLTEFCKCILKKMRVDVDWLTRYGGEEFLVVLPETILEGASRLAERIRQAVSQCEIKWQGEVIRLTSSFGVTGFDHSTPEDKVSPDALIREADKNLYQSKHEGRNRVTTTPL